MPVLSTLGAAIANVYGFTSGLIKDQYFNLVSLLLPGNGTDGKQNRTFKDSSVNDFLITPNGNATQGTFSPFSQTGWGNYFNGSSYLTSSHPALNATFTIEAWIYRTSGSALQSIIFLNAGGNSGVIVYIDASNYLTVTDGSTGQSAFSNLTVPINSWTHIAVVRSGGTTTGYVNGTVAGSHTFTPSTVNAATIARYSAASPLYFPGYVSNVRVVNGTAVYTGAFTPSTVPLTAITNTSLLTCQSNRFIDNSSSPLTITASGSPSVTPFSPFAPTQSYSAAAVGGSGYFDGSGDYLSVADNAAFTMGTGDFTVEYWVYWNGTSSTFRAYGQVDSGGSLASISIRGGTDASNKVINGAFSGTTDYLCTSTASLVANTWNHIAFVRDGTTLRQYINGGQDGTASISTASVNDSSSQFAIGRAGEFNGNYFGGYISSFRLLKGTCLYPSGTAFTPPTAPLTNITNTSLLLNFTNAGVVDATAKNVLETVGTAQISNTTSKFPPTSIYLSGDGNYLTSRSSPVFSLNGDFTMEAWVYPINAGRSADAEKYGTIVSCAAVGVSNPEFSWFIRIVGGVVTEYFLNLNFTTVLQVTGLSVSLNAWHYFAVTRSGTGTGNLKLYIDGTLVGTSSGAVTQSATFTSAQTLMVGRNAGSTAYQNWLSGYFQDVRITPGYVRTVTTVPTAPFPVQ
jgi:hypothetical protein